MSPLAKRPHALLPEPTGLPEALESPVIKHKALCCHGCLKLLGRTGVCVCEREREREKKRGRDRERERQKVEEMYSLTPAR